MSSKFKSRFLLISISLIVSILISLIFVLINGTNNEFNYYEFLLIVILSLIIIYIFGVIYTRFFLYNKLKEISKDILPSIDISQTVTTNMLFLIHLSEPTRPRLISYAVFCLKKKKTKKIKIKKKPLYEA